MPEFVIHNQYRACIDHKTICNIDRMITVHYEVPNNYMLQEIECLYKTSKKLRVKKKGNNQRKRSNELRP